MKKIIISSTLSILSLFADYQNETASFTIDNRDTKFFYQFDLKLAHQSTFELDDCNLFILHALSNPHLDNTYHHELGVGFRRMYENFGFGTNIVYANQYAFGFFNHQLVPGIELFYKDFKFAYNRYLPVKTIIEKNDLTYLFHDVSEISLSYRLWEKIQIGFTPYYNHQTQRLGFGGVVSAFIFDNLELALAPYCEPQVQHGVAFSLSYHFGGVREKENSPLSKSNRFFFTKNQKEVKKFSPNPAPVIMPSTSPVVVSPSGETDKKMHPLYWLLQGFFPAAE